MTDHTKALADALERALSIIGPGWEDGQGRPLAAWHKKASKQLAAYRAAPAQQVEQWHPSTEPLEYLTRCSDGTTFRNVVKLPAHAMEWAVAVPTPSLTVGERTEPATWPHGIDIADEIESLMPQGFGYATRAAVEQWWRDLVERKLSKIATPAAQAEPLSDEQIETARLAELIPFGSERRAFINGIRLAERAHGIAKRCAEICRTTDLFVDEWKAGEKCAAAIREHFGIEGE